MGSWISRPDTYDFEFMDDCAICGFSYPEDDLMKPCYNCSVSCHQHCINMNMKRAIFERKLKFEKMDIRDWVKWLFSTEQHEDKKISEPDWAPIVPRKIVIHDKKSLTFGFVDSSPMTTFTISDMLLLVYMKPNDSAYIKCPQCETPIRFYGKKSRLEKVNRILDSMKLYSVAISTFSGLLFLGLFIDFTVTGPLCLLLDWINDFYVPNKEISIFDFARVFFVPHFVYTMTQPFVGILNLLSACIYATFNFGIPERGITNKLQQFIYTKLGLTLLYRLSLNRYYYESFKKTIPAVFAAKLSIEESWAIQEYRNETPYEEYYELSFWKKCTVWFRDTWYCIKEDFGELYRTTYLDTFFRLPGSVLTLFIGLFLAHTPLVDQFYSIYYTDSQNNAIYKLAAIMITQIIYFCISSFDSIATAECYKGLKPNLGFIDIDEIKRVFKLYEIFLEKMASLFNLMF